MANERFASFMEAAPKTFLQGLYEESSTQKHPLGTKRVLSDGREYIYVQNGGANLAAGFLAQAPIGDVANTANLAIAANAAAGNKAIYITNGDHDLLGTANAFAEGWIWVNTGSGVIGDLYKIRGHAAIAANAAGWINLYDTIRTALTTSHKVSVRPNAYKGVLLDAGTAVIVGAAFMDLTANYYGWLQLRGPCALSTDGTVVLMNRVYNSAGEIIPSTANGNDMSKLCYIGKVISVNANDHASLVMLEL